MSRTIVPVVKAHMVRQTVRYCTLIGSLRREGKANAPNCSARAQVPTYQRGYQECGTGRAISRAELAIL
jgi:hypothetical protein